MNALLRSIALTVSITLALPAMALADGIAVLRGQFAEGVERGRPVGEPATVAQAERVLYWLQVQNPTGQAGELTLVWKVDGRVAHRERLTINAQRRWTTWAFHNVRRARVVNVEVLAADGTVIHTEELTRTPAGS